MTQLDLFAKEEATKIFIKLGFSVSLQGFKYMRDCVVKVVKKPKLVKKVTIYLYPEVGFNYSANGAVVERCMRHATELAFRKTGFVALNSILELDEYNFDNKPTNCELIALIAEAIRLKAEKIGLLDK